MIEDELEEPSRVGTPVNVDEKAALKVEDDAPATAGSVNGNKKVEEKDSSPPRMELPADVKAKLRKLDKLESRYQGELLQAQGYCYC